jgi:dTMP kinase
LARRNIVLCDRFSDSTRAYQGQAGGAGRDAVETLDALIVGNTQPDITLILDLDPAIGLSRAAARRGNEDRFESKDLAFHNALRASYLEIAANDPARCRVLDATISPADLLEAAWQMISAHLASPS